ncbi:MAG: class I SAM-dependent methyltransferase [Pseudomonadales bacterium]|nr:class I SAM-dependent methyltransferase [Pseudomonadales bacterium]
MNKSKEKWNRIYSNKTEPASTTAFLTQHQHLLPSGGHALDLASGLGANAQFLHENNLTVDAWDISDVAIERIDQYYPHIHTQVRDVETQPPQPNQYDVIVVTDFLHRPICPQISAALKPNGLLFYQTFCVHKITSKGPSNPNFLLKNNELLELFPSLTVLFYQENGRYGNLDQGDRNRASLIAAKPAG